MKKQSKNYTAKDIPVLKEQKKEMKKQAQETRNKIRKLEKKVEKLEEKADSFDEKAEKIQNLIGQLRIGESDVIVGDVVAYIVNDKVRYGVVESIAFDPYDKKIEYKVVRIKVNMDIRYNNNSYDNYENLNRKDFKRYMTARQRDEHLRKMEVEEREKKLTKQERAQKKFDNIKEAKDMPVEIKDEAI